MTAATSRLSAADEPTLRLWPLRDGHLVAVAWAGGVVMTAASWWVGATPVTWGSLLPVPGNLLFYLGLAALTSAWLLLGQRVLAGTVEAAVLRRFALAGAAPFVLAAPMGRDLWAYAAQGHLVGRGVDPYRFGPSHAPGAFAREVSPRWIDAPAPYGPVWLRLSQVAAWMSHHHPVFAALLLRLPAFAGLALCLWALPVIARRLGLAERLVPGLWVGAAGPLMIVLGVGGGHNDLLMLGLALAGLALATRPGLRWLAAGAALGALGVLVKSPAAIVVAFTVPVWLGASGSSASPRRALQAVGAAVLGSGAVLAAGTAVGGLGTGWTKAVNSDAQWVSWLSLPSALTMLGKFATGSDAPRGVDDTLRTVRTVGEVVAVLVLVGLWLLAVRRPRESLGLLTAALGTAALLGPSVQPWYYLWGLLLAGFVVTRHRAVLLLALVAVVFPIMITPSGVGLESTWAAIPVIVLAGALVWTFLAAPVADPGQGVRR